MDTHKLRTYGKKAGGMKRKQESDDSSALERPTTPTKASTSNMTKRRKISPVPQLLETTGSQSPKSTDTDSYERQVPASPSKVQTPLARRTVQSLSSRAQPTTTRDLSGIFDSMLSPSSSTASPTKLAKRMLARSKTEPSINSNQSPDHDKVGVLERTPSLPTLPPSPSKSSQIPKRTSNMSASLIPVPPPAKPATRTYAGQFRSFLVNLPPSTANALTAEEESESRESYNSLRSRWDVDNSEDDPYPFMPSPSRSKSTSATPDMSPFRSGKGKSKATNPPVRLAPIPYGLSNPLKSISELRNKGESRRFLDELGYLFEGMGRHNGLGLRRASALEITVKLCDEDFARKAKAADFYTRAWDLFLEAGSGTGEDKVLDVLLTFYVALVARDPTSLAELTQQTASPPPSPSLSSKQNVRTNRDEDPSFFTILFTTLAASHKADLLTLVAPHSRTHVSDLKSAGVNKKDWQMLTTVYNTIATKSNIFPEDTTISTPLLISYALHALPPHCIPITYLPTFIASLRLSFSSNLATDLASSLSSQWLDTAKALPYQSIYYHLRLLDSYLLDQWDASNNESSSSPAQQDCAKRNEDEMNIARKIWLVDDLGALGVCVELMARDREDESFPVRRYLDAILRVLVTLTHMDQLWAEKAVQADYVLGFVLRTLVSSVKAMQPAATLDAKKEEDDDDDNATLDDAANGSVKDSTNALDTLCLTLGLLTNLVQNVTQTKLIMRKFRLDPSCALRKRKCALECCCARRANGIQILADVYLRQQAKIESSSPSLLVQDSPEAQAEAEASFLRGHLAVLFGLLMMGNVDNETAILAAVMPAVDPSGDKTARRRMFARFVEQAKDFAAFYTAVSGAIAEGERESTVTESVVKFLEGKRDSVV